MKRGSSMLELLLLLLVFLPFLALDLVSVGGGGGAAVSPPAALGGSEQGRCDQRHRIQSQRQNPDCKFFHASVPILGSYSAKMTGHPTPTPVYWNTRPDRTFPGNRLDRKILRGPTSIGGVDDEFVIQMNEVRERASAGVQRVTNRVAGRSTDPAIRPALS